MVLAKARAATRMGESGLLNVGVIAAVTCLQGGLAILAGGFARPGRLGQGADNAAKAADAATYRAVGVFAQTVTGGAANGDVKVDVQAGIWPFKNSAAGDAITAADIGRYCFIIDDETVAKTNPNSVRAVAGVVMTVDADTTVWVNVSPQITAALG